MAGLQAFLSPRSVAVFGASDDPTRIGGRALFNLKQAGFEGALYPINPRRDVVQGVRAFPSLRDVPGEVECAVIAVPGEAVLQVVQACADKGVRAAVIFSAGFAEAGPEGVERQAQLKAVAQAARMRVIGPNCMGLYNTFARTWLSFTALYQERVDGPAIGMVSQSGGSSSQLLKLAQLRGMAVGVSITTGNEVDVDFGEGLEALAEDPNVSVIMGYIEGVRSRAFLIRGLAAARRNRKPVIVLKVGRTLQGALAAASHTASLAGEDRVYDAVFRAYGVYRARTNEEMLDVAYAASRSPLPAGDRLGVVTISGGMGAQIADVASDAGLELPTLSPETQAWLKALCPPGSPTNPVDITAQLSTDPGLLAASIRLVLESGQVDACLAFFGVYAGIPALDPVFRRDLQALRTDFPDAVVALGAVCPPEIAAAYAEMGFLIFEEPARAVQALGALRSFAAAFDAPDVITKAAPAPTIVAGTRYDEASAKAILAQVGIRSPAERRTPDAAAAAEAAAQMRLPVALKIISADILHKTDVGGVALGLQTPQAVAEAAEVMLAKVARARPEAQLDGLLVSEMVGAGVDLILGARVDPLFGPLLLVGFGGVAAELFDDTALRLAPVDREAARAMLASLKSYPLLTGFRGSSPLDVEAALDALVGLSALISANSRSVETIEINPLRVLAQGVVALDAVIETRSPPPGDA